MAVNSLLIAIISAGAVLIIGGVILGLVLKKPKPKVEINSKDNPSLPKPQIVKTGIAEINKDQAMFKIEETIIPELPEAKDPRLLDIKYPLVPPYAYAHINWDSPNTELVYTIEEPQLIDKEKEILKTLEEGIRELINLSFISVKNKDTVLLYLEKNIRVLLTELSIELSLDSYKKIMYYIYRDFVGLNEIEPLMNDTMIEDIECNGLNSPVYLVHRKYRNIRTNLVFTDIHKMASFVEKLAQKCGRYVSYAEPLLDGSLPDNSRVNATYSTDVSSKGPTFCIAGGYIQLNNGNVQKIEDLFEKSKKDFGYKLEDENEIVEVLNLNCCGVDENNLKQYNSKIKTIIKLKPPKTLVEIKLQDGTEIITTTNHLFHIANDKLRLIEARDLKHGMMVPLPSKVNVKVIDKK